MSALDVQQILFSKEYDSEYQSRKSLLIRMAKKGFILDG